MPNYVILDGTKTVAHMSGPLPSDMSNIRVVPDVWDWEPGRDIREYDDNLKLLPLAERVSAKLVTIPSGQKVSGEQIVPMTQAERYRDGLDPIPDGMILDGDDIRPMTRSELVAAGTLTQAQADALDAQDRIAAIKSWLTEIDTESARSLRAVIAGTATDVDKQKLIALETEAQTLRAELATLEVTA